MLNKLKANKAWTTKTGEKIFVKDLTDSHLINIIKLLNRISAAPAFLKYTSELFKIHIILSGEHSRDVVLLDLDREIENPVLYIAPEYKYLFDEANKRNLVY